MNGESKGRNSSEGEDCVVGSAAIYGFEFAEII